MVLADSAILEALEEHDLHIRPYSLDAVQPASYDIHLGDMLIVNGSPWNLNERPCTLIRGCPCVLGTTVETIELSSKLCASIGGLSSLGRAGLVVTPGAPWVDPGFCGELTLEITHTGFSAYILEAGQRIAQLVFHPVQGKVLNPYQGRYQAQSGPTESRE